MFFPLPTSRSGMFPDKKSRQIIEAILPWKNGFNNISPPEGTPTLLIC
jgi:hypothetical protein